MFVNYRSFWTTQVSFSENVSRLFQNISNKERVLSISIFGLVEKDEYLSNLEIIHSTALTVFGRLPLIGYIAQSPEKENTLIAEVCYLTEEISLSTVRYHEIQAGRYLTIKTNEFSALLIDGMISGNIQKSIGEQSFEVFNKIQQILSAFSMPVENIVRQWNYIGNITAVENNLQNYQEFNNKRALFYMDSQWEHGFPAATGISMDINALMVSLLALKFHDETQVFPLNNSFQHAAHRYSDSVLGTSMQKQTPKFERAKLLISNKSAFCFISGTAAILGEKSVENNHIGNQTLQTIALINHLISPENLKENGIDFSGKLKIVHLRVYVKNPTDFEIVHEVVEAEFPDVNVFYVCAPVCRDELLVEIEGIAVTQS
jgi:hypothetical protein